MPAIRLITINGSGGAFVDILASIFARRAELIEDDAGSGAQGLDFKSSTDAFATTSRVTSGHEPIILGNIVAHGGGRGALLGVPAYNSGGASISATKLLSVRSASVTATVGRFLEIE